MSLTAAFDEMDGSRRPGPRALRSPCISGCKTQKIDDLKRKREDAEALFRRTGITFAVYGDDAATERLIPFDIIPRILSAAEWRRLAAGIEQRVRALNAFMYDIYHRQEIIRAGRIPEDLIIQNAAFLPEMMCVEPARGIYSHIIGIDIVRTSENEFFVLEDNTRTPSGVSYMLENREAMMHMFPELFARNRVRGGGGLPRQPAPARSKAWRPTASIASRPWSCSRPASTTAPTSSTRSWPTRWASSWSRGRTSSWSTARCMMKTTQGLKQVDVVYRRIDDAFLDPLVFRRDSVLGRARHLRCLSRRPAHHRQRAGRRHRRRQVDLHLHARHRGVLHGPRRRS